MRPRTRDAFIILTGRALLAPFFFVSIPLMTFALAPAEVGRMALITAAQGWFGLLLISPVGNYVQRRFVEWSSRGLIRSRMLIFTGYSCMAGVLSGIVMITVADALSLGLGERGPWVAALVAGNLGAHTAFASASVGLNILTRRTWYVLLTLGSAWLGLGASAVLTLRLERSAEMWLTGQLLVEAALALVAWTALPARPAAADVTLPSEWVAGALRTVLFSWPLTVSAMLYWLQTQGYSFVVAALFGPDLLGALVISLGIGARVLTAYERLFTDFYLPLFYNDLAQENRPSIAWERYASRLLPTLLIVAAFAVFAGPSLLRLLTTPAYHAYAALAGWGALVEAARIAMNGVALAFHAHLRTGPLVVPSLTSSLVLAAGLVAVGGVPVDAARGVTGALLLGSAAGGVTVSLLALRLLRVELPWWGLRKAAAWSVPLIAVAVAMEASEQVFSTRSTLGIVAIGVLYSLLGMALVSEFRFIDARRRVRSLIGKRH